MPNRDVMSDDVVPEQGLGDRFAALFQKRPRIYRAPGRVNLIGEHTDYNDGFVMPAAIGFSTWVVVALRDHRKLSIFSENCSELIEFDLAAVGPQAKGHWSNYVTGVALALAQAGHQLRGASLRSRGEVPVV